MFTGENKFNYDDIYNFLPDNKTVGTYDFYDKKFNGMLDEFNCRYLEAKSRKEYDENKILEIINDYKEHQKRIMERYNEIVNSVTHDISIESEKNDNENENEIKLKCDINIIEKNE
jgi:hypothetical protein